MTGIKFAEATVPAVTREPKPLQYVEQVKHLADNREKALTVDGLTEKDGKDLLREFRRTSETHGVTIRVSTVAGKKEGTVNLTLWAVDRITRERKQTEDAAN